MTVLRLRVLFSDLIAGQRAELLNELRACLGVASNLAELRLRRKRKLRCHLLNHPLELTSPLANSLVSRSDRRDLHDYAHVVGGCVAHDPDHLGEGGRGRNSLLASEALDQAVEIRQVNG